MDLHECAVGAAIGSIVAVLFVQIVLSWYVPPSAALALGMTYKAR